MEKAKNETDLNKYKKKGKTLLPPLAQINFTTSSWINDRLPDMLWAVLIVSNLPQEEALDIFRTALKTVEGNKELWNVTLSGIENFNNEDKNYFIKELLGSHEQTRKLLRPMLLFQDLPAYDSWKENIGLDPVQEDWKILANSLAKCLWHHSQEATDCRWVKLLGQVISGKLKYMNRDSESLKEILEYPNYGDQKKVRATIRASEIGSATIDKSNYKWSESFWKKCYESTDCIPELQGEAIKKQNELQEFSEAARKDYSEQSVLVRNELINHFFNTSKSSQINPKHETVFGLALFSLGFFIENNFYRTPLSVNGRSMLRSLFEAYISLAYLMKLEKDGNPQWIEYREYGSGQANLIYRQYEEQNFKSSMVNPSTVEKIANEDKWVEFVPINLGHWDSSDLRNLSDAVGEKSMYDKYYPYTSAYSHGNWFAVRESVYQKCMNPLHRLHVIPSYDLPLLQSVTEDMIEIVNKVLTLVNTAYPETKERIKEIKPTKKPKKRNPDTTNKT